MRTLMAAATLAVLVGLTALPGAQVGEKKVDLDKVPKAVMDAVKAKYPEAKLLGASTEKDGDKVVFEISLEYKNHHHDVTLETDGKIVSIERTIPFKDLPKAVAAAVKAKYPKATPKITEELYKGDGTLHGYEVLLEISPTSGVELVLDLQGKITKEEKKDTKKDDKK